jgi:hypothetical protein
MKKAVANAAPDQMLIEKIPYRIEQGFHYA